MDNLAGNIKEVVSLKSGVTRLTLTDFRNYAFLRVSPGLRPVIITGENGSGKTNILEAISFLTPGRGLRSARLADIRRFTPAVIDADYLPAGSWGVSATVFRNGEEFEIGTATETGSRECHDEIRSFDRRIVKINGQKGVSQNELGQYLSAVWLTPQMDRLFRGGSQPRRSFLDRLVYAFDTEHAKRTSVFEHLYKQWYQLLKSTNGHADAAWLTSLEEDMAAAGVAIAAARREQIARLNRFIESTPDDVFPDVEIALEGTVERQLDSLPAVEVEDAYRSRLARERHRVLENDGVMAYYLMPQIDNFSRKIIRVNASAVGEDTITLYSTLAHEGYPGHLYQNEYFCSTEGYHEINALFTYLGYAEGWASVVGAMAYDWCCDDKNVASCYRFDTEFSMLLAAWADIGVNYYGWDTDDVYEMLSENYIDSYEAAELFYEMSVSDPCIYLPYTLGYYLTEDTIEELKDSGMSEMEALEAFLNVGPCTFEVLHKHLGLE